MVLRLAALGSRYGNYGPHHSVSTEIARPGAVDVTSAIRGCRIHIVLNQSLLEESHAVLGKSLVDRAVTFEIVAVGGGSLLLLGLISRPTADLDVVAFIEAGRYVKPAIRPRDLADAARATARVMGIREDWINTGPAALLDFGLPARFANRTVERRYGGLVAARSCSMLPGGR